MDKVNYMMAVDEVMDELCVSKGYAYRLVREMNQELKDLGYFTIPGKVPRAYFGTRFYGCDQADTKDGEGAI